MREVARQYLRNRELSIQIGLNGFSFVVFEVGQAAEGGGVDARDAIVRSVAYRETDMVSILAREPMLTSVTPPIGRVFVGCATDNVLLVPQSLFEAERAEQYLTAANMYVPGMTTLSNNLISPQAAAVWQVDSGAAAVLLQLYPEALFYHPLLLELESTPDNHVHVVLDGEVAHVTVCHTGLYAAETMRVSTPEELLYYVQKLLKNDGFTAYRMILTGEGVGQLHEFFARYFCEVDAREVRFYNHQRVRELCAL